MIDENDVIYEDDFEPYLSQLNPKQWEALRQLIQDLKAIVEKENQEKIQKEAAELDRHFASALERGAK
jgi:FlaA1/EpsC-like NDP-sugar epimerase